MIRRASVSSFAAGRREAGGDSRRSAANTAKAPRWRPRQIWSVGQDRHLLGADPNDRLAKVANRKKGPSINSVAVHRVQGGSAPSPLAKTRSDNPRRKASSVTIRRADGSTDVMWAKEFAARHETPAWVAANHEYSAQPRVFRAGKITQAQLRAFAETHGLEQRLDAALQRGAGGRDPGREPARGIERTPRPIGPALATSGSPAQTAGRDDAAGRAHERTDVRPARRAGTRRRAGSRRADARPGRPGARRVHRTRAQGDFVWTLRATIMRPSQPALCRRPQRAGHESRRRLAAACARSLRLPPAAQASATRSNAGCPSPPRPRRRLRRAVGA